MSFLNILSGLFVSSHCSAEGPVDLADLLSPCSLEYSNKKSCRNAKALPQRGSKPSPSF